MDQARAVEEMGVSRETIQRLLTSGRRKVVAAVLAEAAIRIKIGVEVVICAGIGRGAINNLLLEVV